jgi:hypothetical protein
VAPINLFPLAWKKPDKLGNWTLTTDQDTGDDAPEAVGLRLNIDQEGNHG